MEQNYVKNQKEKFRVKLRKSKLEKIINLKRFRKIENYSEKITEFLTYDIIRQKKSLQQALLLLK